MRRRCSAGCTALLLFLLAAVPASAGPSDKARDHDGLAALLVGTGIQATAGAVDLGLPDGPISPSGADQTTSARDGTVYFAGPGSDGRAAADIYRARRTGSGRYAPPELLSGSVNTAGREYAPFIAPDGSFLLFAREDPLLGIDGFFLSFRTEDDEWTEAIYLREFVPTSGHCLSITLTPDGGTVVFSEAADGRRRTGQVEAGFVEELRQQVFGRTGSAIKARAGAGPRFDTPPAFPWPAGQGEPSPGVASPECCLDQIVKRPEAVVVLLR